MSLGEFVADCKPGKKLVISLADDYVVEVSPVDREPVRVRIIHPTGKHVRATRLDVVAESEDDNGTT